MRSRSHDQMGLSEEIERVYGARYFGNPLFTGAGTRRVLVQLRGPLGGRRYFIAPVLCELAKSSCTQGRRVRHRALSANVDNPSRPLR